MTHGMKPEPDDRPRHKPTDAAIAPDHEAPLDHHIEELLGAFSDLDLRRRHGAAEPS